LKNAFSENPSAWKYYSKHANDRIAENGALSKPELMLAGKYPTGTVFGSRMLGSDLIKTVKGDTLQ
jgi:hypothetical protein